MNNDSKYVSQGIIKALKSGNVPWKGVDKIIVGREPEVRQIQQELEFVVNGGSVTKFFEGPYGSGKTLMASMIREIAWDKNFIVAALDLGRQAPFNKFEVVYSKIMQSLRSREFPNIPVIDLILQEWLISLENSIERTEGLDRMDPNDRREIERLVQNEIEERLKTISSIQPTFAAMIRSYYRERLNGNNELAEAAVAIIRGDKNISAKKKRLLNYKGTITREDTFIYLRAFVQLLKEIGYAGLVIIFDEAELIRGLANRRLRNVAHENVRNIYDSCSNGNFKNTYFAFFGTPDWFEDEDKGIPSYKALNDRIKTTKLAANYRDLRSAIITLEGLNKEGLRKLADKIIDIHSDAYEWNAKDYIPDHTIDNIISFLGHRFGVEQTVNPRVFCKIIVDLLDLVNQHPTIDLDKEFQLDSQITVIKQFEETEAHITTIE